MEMLTLGFDTLLLQSVSSTLLHSAPSQPVLDGGGGGGAGVGERQLQVDHPP